SQPVTPRSCASARGCGPRSRPVDERRHQEQAEDRLAADVVGRAAVAGVAGSRPRLCRGVGPGGRPLSHRHRVRRFHDNRDAPRPPAVVVACAATMLLFRLVIAIDAGRRVRTGSIVGRKPWYRSAWVAAVSMIALDIAWSAIAVDYYRPGWRSFRVASGSEMP